MRSLNKQFQRLLQGIPWALKSINIFKSQEQAVPHQAFSSQHSGRPTHLDWVIANKLCVGDIPQLPDLALLTNSKIRVILSLCAPTEGMLPPEIEQKFYCLRLILPDSHYSTPLTAERLAQAVQILHQCDQRGLPIYVHCLAGIERSPTVCIAYLCRYYHLELWEAIALLKQARPVSCPSPTQIQVIRQYLRINLNKTP